MIQTPWRTRSPASAAGAGHRTPAGRRSRPSASRSCVDPVALGHDLRLGRPAGRRGWPRRGRRRARAPAARPAGAPGRSGRRAPGACPVRTRRCPRTASCSTPARARGVDGPRRRRQVGAVDRRAARGVGDDHAVAEQLADELDVGRLAAAAAGARELEQRLEHLAALDGVVGDAGSRSSGGIDWKKSQRPRSTSRCSATGSMLMALWLHLGLALGRADVDADAAAGAVVGRDLDRQAVAGQVAATGTPCAGSPPARRRPRRSGRPSCGSSACGQTMAHLPQSMQIVGSQIGISWAMARFS